MDDPWKSHQNELELNDNNLSFEDNFNPEISNYTALSDSKEYLDSLERKLRKIKKDSNLLKELADRRQLCLENLLNGENRLNTNSDFELEEVAAEIISGPAQEIIRHIRPEQPLSVGEIVHIVKYDFLDLEATTEEEQEKSSTDSAEESR